MPGNGIAGQSNGPWGIVNGVFYYENNGSLGRAELTNNGVVAFPSDQSTGPWHFTGTNAPVTPSRATRTAAVADGAPEVFPRTHGAAIDNGDSRSTTWNPATTA